MQGRFASGPQYLPFRLRLNAECGAAGVDFELPQLVERVNVFASAQFIVSRGAIRRRPLAFWQALLRTLLGVREELDPDSQMSPRRKQGAFWLEVMWSGLFRGNFSEAWRGYDKTCGPEGGSAAPLLAVCCESVEHEAYRGMLESAVVDRHVGPEVWSRHSAHDTPRRQR